MLNFKSAAQELVKLLILKDQFDFVCHSLTIRGVRKKSSICIHRNAPCPFTEPYIRMGSMSRDWGCWRDFAHKNPCNVARGSQVEELDREHSPLSPHRRYAHHWDTTFAAGGRNRIPLFRRRSFSARPNSPERCLQAISRMLILVRVGVLPSAASADNGPIDEIARTCGRLPRSSSRRFWVLYFQPRLRSSRLKVHFL